MILMTADPTNSVHMVLFSQLHSNRAISLILTEHFIYSNKSELILKFTGSDSAICCSLVTANV